MFDKRAIIDRTIEARKKFGTQEEMAEALGMPRSSYVQYEVRSALALPKLIKFCLITKRDPYWLLSGIDISELDEIKEAILNKDRKEFIDIFDNLNATNRLRLKERMMTMLEEQPDETEEITKDTENV